jgi:hypothetical protein
MNLRSLTANIRQNTVANNHLPAKRQQTMKKIFYLFVLLIPQGLIQAQTGLNFDASAYTYVSIPYIENTFNYHDFTIEAWVYPESNNEGVIFGMGDYDDVDKAIEVKIYGGYFSVWHWYDNWTNIYPVTPNTWYHIAYTYNASTKTGYFYVNGTYIGSYTFGGYLDVESNSMYGSIGFSGWNRYFDGTIDELRVWNVERSSSEIADNMNSTVCTGDPNLVAYFQFEDGKPCANNSNVTMLQENSGNYNGTFQGYWAFNGCTGNFTQGILGTCNGLRTIPSSNICGGELVKLFPVIPDAKVIKWQINSGTFWEDMLDGYNFMGYNKDTLLIVPTKEMRDYRIRAIYSANEMTDTTGEEILPLETYAPEMYVYDWTVYLDNTGKASLPKYYFVGWAYDNCSLADTTVSRTEFDCSDLGNTVQVAVTLSDINGNSTTQYSYITVSNYYDIGVQCVGNQTRYSPTELYTVKGTDLDPAVSNCNYTLVNDYNHSNTLDGAQFPRGTTTVQWKVDDGMGNVDSCYFDVIVNYMAGIETVDPDNLVIYPNPSDGLFYISLNNPVQKLEVRDLSGKIVLMDKNLQPNRTIDLSSFENGVYFICIQTDKKTYVQKLIKR